MRVRTGVLADAGDLPGYFQPRLASADPELAGGNLRRDIDRREAPGAGQLVAEIGAG